MSPRRYRARCAIYWCADLAVVAVIFLLVTWRW